MADGPAPAAPESPVPLYLQIHATLKARIVSGQYDVASVLPTETELCAEFKASRYTVREALRLLTENGFVSRRPRIGTVVLSRHPQVSYGLSFLSIEDLFQVANETHYVLLATETVTVDEAIAPRIGGYVGEEWLRVTGVRWDKPGGTPISYIQSYLPRHFAAVVQGFATVRGPFYAVLEKESGEAIEEVTQEISAVPMPDAVIKALGLRPGSLSLLLLRRYMTKSGTLIASFNWHRADEFTYRMQIHRRSEKASPGRRTP